MEAARVAAMRGHEVTLCERKDSLGGQLPLAATPPGREEIGNLTRYLSGQMVRQKVKVWLNQEVDLAFVQAFHPEVVIVATGSFPAELGDFGKMGGPLCYAHEVLAGEKAIGRKVLVVGGGSVGTGTADFLAEKGCEVTLVLRRVDFGSKLEPSTKMVVRKDFDRMG